MKHELQANIAIIISNQFRSDPHSWVIDESTPKEEEPIGAIVQLWFHDER